MSTGLSRPILKNLGFLGFLLCNNNSKFPSSLHASIYASVPASPFPSVHPSIQGRLSLYPGGANALPPKLGERFLGSLGERTKNIDVLMIVISLNWQTVFQIISKFLGVRIVAYCPIGDSCS